jgi:hypothetical protein
VEEQMVVEPEIVTTMACKNSCDSIRIIDQFDRLYIMMSSNVSLFFFFFFFFFLNGAAGSSYSSLISR